MHGKILYTNTAGVQPELFCRIHYSLLLLPAELSEPNDFLESVLKLDFPIYLCIQWREQHNPCCKVRGKQEVGKNRRNEGKSVGRQFPISHCQQYTLIMYIMSSSRENRVICQH